MNKKNNQGFTLVELVVAIVVSSIVLTLVSYFLIRFFSTSKKIKAEQNRTFEQSIIVNYFNDFKDQANLLGKKVTINYNNNIVYTTLDSSEEPISEVIKIDNKKLEIKYNKASTKLETIKSINLVKMDNMTKLFRVVITFDNDETYQFSIYIVGGLLEE